jgi:hypothetical protein
VDYLARRQPYMLYWCAYILPNKELTGEDMELLEDVSHGGITGDCGGPGFDCAHLDDYPISTTGTYRDFEYVLSKLKDMINVISD